MTASNNEIVLTCSDTSFIGRLAGQIADVQQIAPDITDVQTISNNKITLIGHSGTNLIGSDRNLAELSPKNLAKLIADKYDTRKRKSDLTDISLISCEAGMKIRDRCFAQDFLREMQKLDFNNLTVHAMTNPANIQTTGMYVETSKKSYNGAWKMTVSSYSYRSAKDEARDKTIQSTLEEVNRETRQALLLERSRLRIYSCTEMLYSEALALPQNTFSGPKQAPHAVMSDDVAYRITYLKYRYDLLTVEEKLGNDGKQIRELIEELQQNPGYSQTEIDESTTRIAGHKDRYSPMSREVTIAISYLESLKKIPGNSARYSTFLSNSIRQLKIKPYLDDVETIGRKLTKEIPINTGHTEKYINTISELKNILLSNRVAESDVRGDTARKSRAPTQHGDSIPKSAEQFVDIGNIETNDAQNNNDSFSLLLIFVYIWQAISNISYQKPSSEFKVKMENLKEKIKANQESPSRDNCNDKERALTDVKDFLKKEIGCSSFKTTNTI